MLLGVSGFSKFDQLWSSTNGTNLVDFSFYVSITRDNGLRLYDIRYKGKRIMYEVSIR
jgi:hypothetical protein